MSLLGEQTLTRRRRGAPTWATGRHTPAAASDTTFRGSVQPMKGDERQVLPEGVRSLQAKKVYCARGTLRTEDQHAGVPADEVLIGAEVYTVVHVDDSHPLIPHDRAYLVRTQEAA